MFIGTNLSITIVKNPFFIDFVNQTIKCPTYDYLRNQIIETLMSKLFAKIQDKLRSAITISLMVDLWSRRIMAGYIGLGAICIFPDAHRELFVIDFKAVSDRHTAENVKNEIETMVNKHDFNKAKLNGNKGY